MSRASSISSTSGFVTPESSPEISTSPLPSVQDTDTSGSTPVQNSPKAEFLSKSISRDAEIQDNADPADTGIMGDAIYSVQKPGDTSASDFFLERLTNSSRSSLHGSDHLAAELAEFGICDSELLEEDEILTESLTENEEWEEHEMQDRGEGEAFIDGIDAHRRLTHGKKKRWNEAEEELRRGGNRSLAEVCSTWTWRWTILTQGRNSWLLLSY